MRRDKNGHAWNWSPAHNGRAKCSLCGLRQWCSALRGPKGGYRTGYSVGDQWVAEAPKCAGERSGGSEEA